MAIVVGFSGILLFFFVPETFWDRTPRPKSRRPTAHRSISNLLHHPLHHKASAADNKASTNPAEVQAAIEKTMTPRQHLLHEQNVHARFDEAFNMQEHKNGAGEEKVVAPSEPLSSPQARHAAMSVDGTKEEKDREPGTEDASNTSTTTSQPAQSARDTNPRTKFKPTGLTMPNAPSPFRTALDEAQHEDRTAHPDGSKPSEHLASGEGTKTETDEVTTPHLHNLNSPYYLELEKGGDYLSHHSTEEQHKNDPETPDADLRSSTTNLSLPGSKYSPSDLEMTRSRSIDEALHSPKLARYTTNLRRSPPKSYLETLRPWNGRLNKSNWWLVALRPFILYAYPSVLWSALTYSLSIGWLIVLSESISNIYKNRETYNFTSLQAGLVYISPFIGGILGTAVAGKVSDIIVRFMARKNGGVYEPEFRLVMAIPVAITTAIGLMGFGWSAQERDAWIVPTFFFGVISFGCSLGSTTAITFCVDSYRQFAGEALVTLNFSKNIFHGLVFSLFFATWLEDEGPKTTFLAIGAIQLACMLLTIPMYIYGKRARMWTVRKAFMEKF